MTPKKIQALIAYHQAGLSQHRYAMSISALYLEEQTIKALQDLLATRRPS